MPGFQKLGALRISLAMIAIGCAICVMHGAMAPAALAQTRAQNMQRCNNSEVSVAPDAQIAACSEIIKSNYAEYRISIAYYNRGNARAGKKEWDLAIADYTEAARLDPSDAAIWNNRGITYAQLQQFDQALSDLSEAIRLNPQHATAFSSRAMVYDMKGERERAIADYRKALELNPDDAESRNALASLESPGGEPGPIEDLPNATPIAPPTPVAPTAEVMIGRHKVKGRTPEGGPYRGKLDIGLKDGVYHFRWYISSGEIYDGQGKLEGDTLTIHWDDPTPVIYKVKPNGVLQGTWGGGGGTETVTPEKETIAQNNIGKDCDFATFEAGHTDKVIKGCTELLNMWKGPTGQKSDSIVPTFFMLRAFAYAEKNADDKALADIASAIQLSPTMASAYSLRATIRKQRNELKQALDDIDKAISLSVPPNQPSASYHYSRGDILERMGDATGAQVAFGQALSIDHSHEQARARIDAYQRAKAESNDPRDGCITMGIGDQKNIDACTRFIAANPSGPDLAAAYAKRGWAYHWGFQNPDPNPNIDLALADYSRAIELDPGNDDHYLQRGKAYQEKGNFDLAASDFEKSLSIAPTRDETTRLLAQVKSDHPQDCRLGAEVSVTGKITSAEDSEGGKYLAIAQDKPGCKVYGAFAKSIPAECVAGASVDVSGTIDDEGDVFEPTKLNCR